MTPMSECTDYCRSSGRNVWNPIGPISSPMERRDAKCQIDAARHHWFQDPVVSHVEPHRAIRFHHPENRYRIYVDVVMHCWFPNTVVSHVELHRTSALDHGVNRYRISHAMRCWLQDPMVSHVEPDRTIRLTRSQPCSSCKTARPSLSAAYLELAESAPGMELAAEHSLHSSRRLSQTSSLLPLLPGEARATWKKKGGVGGGQDVML